MVYQVFLASYCIVIGKVNRERCGLERLPAGRDVAWRDCQQGEMWPGEITKVRASSGLWRIP